MSRSIAVFSDIHDAQDHLAWLLRRLEQLKPAALIGCGDYSSPDTMVELAALKIPIYFCLGNTDQMAAQAFQQAARSHANLHFCGQVGRIQLENKKIAFTHYPHQATALAEEGGLDAVFFGHSHRRHLSQENGILLANPGDIQNRHGDGPSFLLWEPESGKAEHILP